ncbi:uncharacterized protein B0H18DRAFT_591529 [Fomitopsis serialis]|uniref:uncharacterized protein n=1 Tax=Fomitopsis serialis TaxID=139415 RepID=UPI0020085AE3|nr:uncharacterized protein B0H18DRAFT_591529 [Neoantrodia serialis]KAH9907634.1 hypothetical protein B0H18DRAFT_591529 [Neoantrodia serialis]
MCWHFPTEVPNTDCLRTAEPYRVQLKDRPVSTDRHLAVDTPSGDDQSRATAVQEDVHSLPEVQGSGPLEMTEPRAVQLTSPRQDIDRFYEQVDIAHPQDNHERPVGGADTRAVPRDTQTRVRGRLAELSLVQLAALNDLAPHGTRPAAPPSTATLLDSRDPASDSRSPVLGTGTLCSTLDGSGDTQQSRAAQDSHDARASPAPSNKVEKNVQNGERTGTREIRKREEGEGYGASKKNEHRGSMNAAHVSTTIEVVVRAAGHEDGTCVPRDDRMVVRLALLGSTVALRDDLAIVPYIPLGGTTNASQYTPDVPHLAFTSRRVASTPSRSLDVHATGQQQGSKLEVPEPAHVSTTAGSAVGVAGREDGMVVLRDDLRVVPSAILEDGMSVVHTTGHDDRTKAIRDDLMVALSDFQGNTPVIRDDLAVVPSVPQGDMTDEQHCSFDVSQSSVHTTGEYRVSRRKSTPSADVLTSTSAMPTLACVTANVEPVVRNARDSSGHRLFISAP